MPTRLAQGMKRLSLVAFVLIGLLLIGNCVVSGVLWWEAESVQRHDDSVWRDGLCIWICEPRGEDVTRFRVWEQRLGFDAYEWRCGCTDGHVQVIP